MEKAYLSVPELRELIQALHPLTGEVFVACVCDKSVRGLRLTILIFHRKD